MAPNEVNSENEQHLLNTVYNYKRLMSTAEFVSANRKVQHRRSAAFKVGDYVRLSKYRMQFDKGYTPNWTAEVFKVRKVQYHTDPITYLLDDYRNQEIKGAVYAEELQASKQPDVFLVDKVIRKRNGQAYVKWLGFGPEHNSWIPQNNIL